jgi:hypothetical protein
MVLVQHSLFDSKLKRAKFRAMASPKKLIVPQEVAEVAGHIDGKTAACLSGREEADPKNATCNLMDCSGPNLPGTTAKRHSIKHDIDENAQPIGYSRHAGDDESQTLHH